MRHFPFLFFQLPDFLFRLYLHLFLPSDRGRFHFYQLMLRTSCEKDSNSLTFTRNYIWTPILPNAKGSPMYMFWALVFLTSSVTIFAAKRWVAFDLDKNREKNQTLSKLYKVRFLPERGLRHSWTLRWDALGSICSACGQATTTAWTSSLWAIQTYPWLIARYNFVFDNLK